MEVANKRMQMAGGHNSARTYAWVDVAVLNADSARPSVLWSTGAKKTSRGS